MALSSAAEIKFQSDWKLFEDRAHANESTDFKWMWLDFKMGRHYSYPSDGRTTYPILWVNKALRLNNTGLTHVKYTLYVAGVSVSKSIARPRFAHPILDIDLQIYPHNKFRFFMRRRIIFEFLSQPFNKFDIVVFNICVTSWVKCILHKVFHKCTFSVQRYSHIFSEMCFVHIQSGLEITLQFPSVKMSPYRENWIRVQIHIC